jgi:hypothetical protein
MYPNPNVPGHQPDHGQGNFQPVPYAGLVRRSVRPNLSSPKDLLQPIQPVTGPVDPYPQGYGL